MLSEINRALPDLSPSERRVAEWIIAHPKEATRATLAHIAEECKISEPTVIRFCRSVGLSGFRELGIRLTEALSRPAGFVHRDVSPDDTSSDAAIKVLGAKPPVPENVISAGSVESPTDCLCRTGRIGPCCQRCLPQVFPAGHTVLDLNGYADDPAVCGNCRSC